MPVGLLPVGLLPPGMHVGGVSANDRMQVLLARRKPRKGWLDKCQALAHAVLQSRWLEAVALKRTLLLFASCCDL